ncbi:MAG: glycosyltransferase family 2 protein [Dehalococcoidales bacterium]|jgi:cellulose synthase/poly-beta-1,6-N-acetylglucosamine synthase-like glycosyltransferase
MFHWVWLLWFIPMPAFLLFFYRYVQNSHVFINNQLDSVPREHPYLIIMITSKDIPAIVQQVVQRANEVCTGLGMDRSRYEIQVLADRQKNPIENARVILVPEGYATPKHSKGKCRALQFALELRKKEGRGGNDSWIFHLDEESFVTRQCMVSVLQYFARPNAKPVAEGPITYPNNLFTVNPFCATVENLRPYVCYDCVSQMKGKDAPSFIHGSNLLVRADVEESIGWDFKNPASEDQRFGWEIWMKYGNVFDWHGGLLEEQPPYTIGDMVRQRRRWFIGNWYNMSSCHLPFYKKLLITGRWVIWGLGFVSAMATVVVVPLYYLGYPQLIPGWMIPVLVFNTFSWLFGFQVGLFLNLSGKKLSTVKRIGTHLVTLILTFPAGFVDTWAAFSSPFYMRNFKWEPTVK